MRSARRPLSSACAPRRGIGALLLRDQRLHLDEQGACALDRGGDDRARRVAASLGEQQPARVGHAAQPFTRHLEDAELVGGAEPVLQRAQRAQPWSRSPSNDSTVSTTCSSTRGPAIAPSLVT